MSLGAQARETVMQIQIVGHYDHESRRLQKAAREAAAELHLGADVEFKDVETVPGGLYDTVPALLVDGHVKVAGRVPSKNEIGSWLQPRIA